MADVKPRAVRMLEQRRIPHELIAFDPANREAVEVARETGTPPHLVYKTLVVELDPPGRKPYLVMVPATGEVDLKRLAVAVGAKKLRLASHRDAEAMTGLQVGGISALAVLDRGFPVLIDERALAESEVLVSAGVRGFDVRLAVADLIALTGARPVATSGP